QETRPMTTLPEDRGYTEEHEWVMIAPGAQPPADPVRIGITAHAAEELGEVVFAELPEVGTQVTAGEQCGELESTKAVSELCSPVSGKVTEVNEALEDAPEAINDDPFGAGWLFAVEVSGAPELWTAARYAETYQIES